MLIFLPVHRRVNDFGQDGGGAIKTLNPKFATFRGHVFNTLGFELPEIKVRRWTVALYRGVTNRRRIHVPFCVPK